MAAEFTERRLAALERVAAAARKWRDDTDPDDPAAPIDEVLQALDNGLLDALAELDRLDGTPQPVVSDFKFF